MTVPDPFRTRSAVGAGAGGGDSRSREVDAGTGLAFLDTSGVVTRRNEHNVRIPAGVREGQRLRLPGRGGRGCRGDPPGGFYAAVRIEL
ncbi:DnaJ C-terminal domain-containing protein [Kitasatospora griseola]